MKKLLIATLVVFTMGIVYGLTSTPTGSAQDAAAQANASDLFADRTLEAKGLSVEVRNGAVRFETTLHGDSVWAVHERFGLPGNLNSREWRSVILPAWKAANPNIASTRRNWMFKPGERYIVPAAYAEAFLKAAPAPTDSSNNPQPPAPQRSFPWLPLSLIAAAVAGGGLEARRRFRLLHQPVEGGPPMREAIDHDSPDMPRVVHEEFERIARDMNQQAASGRPILMQPSYQEGDIVRDITGEQPAEVMEVVERVGPMARGRIDGGHFLVRYRGENNWKKRVGNGEFVYSAMFRMRLCDGSTQEMMLFFLQGCGNDVRFAGT